MKESRGLTKVRWLIGLFLLLFAPQQINAQSFSLSTGIEGTVSVSPAHGGPMREGMVNSAPLPNAAFDVLKESVAVASFTTDAEGHFRVPLAPGRYSIKPHDPAAKWPRCGSLDVEVTAEGFKTVQLDCDSGMR